MARRSTYILLFLIFNLPVVQAQTSRAESAQSYCNRGNAWLAKGELDRAIADYDLAIVFDPVVYQK